MKRFFCGVGGGGRVGMGKEEANYAEVVLLQLKIPEDVFLEYNLESFEDCSDGV